MSFRDSAIGNTYDDNPALALVHETKKELTSLNIKLNEEIQNYKNAQSTIDNLEKSETSHESLSYQNALATLDQSKNEINSIKEDINMTTDKLADVEANLNQIMEEQVAAHEISIVSLPNQQNEGRE